MCKYWKHCLTIFTSLHWLLHVSITWWHSSYHWRCFYYYKTNFKTLYFLRSYNMTSNSLMLRVWLTAEIWTVEPLIFYFCYKSSRYLHQPSHVFDSALNRFTNTLFLPHFPLYIIHVVQCFLVFGTVKITLQSSMLELDPAFWIKNIYLGRHAAESVERRTIEVASWVRNPHWTPGGGVGSHLSSPIRRALRWRRPHNPTSGHSKFSWMGSMQY